MGDAENLALGMLMSTEVPTAGSGSRDRHAEMPTVGSGSRGRHLQANKKEP